MHPHAYVAVSRGRVTNRIYATRDRGWIDAIRKPGGHTFAIDQHPDVPEAIELSEHDRPTRPDSAAA
jgi:hypothetical protein